MSEHLPGNLLRGRTALVTGAARGIGRAIAVAFAHEGADVLGLDICASPSPACAYPPATVADLEETGRLVAATGHHWLPMIGDIRDRRVMREVVALAEAEFGGLDICVANAGIQMFQPLLEMDDAHWQDTLDVNLTGTANTIRAVAPGMATRGYGRIICVSSTQGRHGMRDGASYSASKWGIIGLMKSAALELGPHGITVNAVIPGLIDTALTRNDTRWREALKDAMPNPPDPPQEGDVVAVLTHKTPLRVPWLRPEDVAPVAVFLASDAAHMVSGATWDVTGGDSGHYSA